MNTTTSRLIRRAPLLLAAAVALVITTAGPVMAETIDWDGPVSLPVGWGPIIAGAIVTLLTNLSTRVDARPWVKVAVATVLSAVAAIVIQLDQAGWSFVPDQLLWSFITTWVWQLLLYLGVVRPTPVTNVLAPDKGLS